MTNEVIWTKLVLERFIQLANLTEEEEIVIRTRAAGWSRVKQAMELNISISGIDRIISRLRKKYDEVQAQVNQLQLQAAMCGVVRYPNATTYCSGSNPFGGCGCGAAI